MGDTYPNQHLETVVRVHFYRWRPKRKCGESGYPTVRSRTPLLQRAPLPLHWLAWTAQCMKMMSHGLHPQLLPLSMLIRTHEGHREMLVG